MNHTVEMAVYALIGLLGLFAQAAISLKRHPKWLIEDEKLKKNWDRLAIYSAIVGGFSTALAASVSTLYDLHGQAVAFAGPIGFALFQGFFTDVRIRYVDRWTLRVPMFTSLVTGIIVLSQYGVESDWVFYLALTAAAFGIGFLPGIGDSDGRAFTILVLSCYPTAAIGGIQWAFVLMIVAIVIYYVATSARKGTFNFKKLFTKISFPMVPLILAPAWVVSIFGSFLPQF